MSIKNIAVIGWSSTADFIGALEQALTERAQDDSIVVTAVAIGTPECALEGLYRGANRAVVVSDSIFAGIAHSTLLRIITTAIAPHFDTILSNGQGEPHPRNSKLILSYKYALPQSKIDNSTPHRELYERRHELVLPTLSAADLGISPDDLPSIDSTLRDCSLSSSSLPAGQVIINFSPDNTAWVDEVVELMLRHRPQRISRRLQDAQIIIGGGYGMGSPEGFEILGELATEMKAKVGATRAAIDAEFCSPKLMIGPTGVRIHPKVYLACGISGQIQHMSGIAEGTTIISINTDPEAPITEIANYVIIGAVEEVLPIILARYKALNK